MKIYLLPLTLLLLYAPGAIAQFDASNENTIDSLKKIIAAPLHDTVRINAYIEWDNMIYNYDPELDKEINKKIINICKKNLDNEIINSEEKIYYAYKLAYGYSNLGSIAHDNGNEIAALEYFEKSMRIRKALNFKRGIAALESHIGNTEMSLGNNSKALNHFHESLKTFNEMLQEETDTTEIKWIKLGIAETYNLIGILYKVLADYEMAEENFREALQLFKELGDSLNIASGYNNIGIIFNEKKDYEKGLKYYMLARDLKLKYGDPIGAALININIGTIYKNQGDSDAAISEYKKSLVVLEEHNRTYPLMNCYVSLGDAYNDINELDLAEKYLKKAEKLSNQTKNKEMQTDSNLRLSRLYYKQNKFKDAYDHLVQYHILDDSLISESEKNSMLKENIQFKYDIKAARDSINFAKEKEINNIQIERTNAQLNTKRLQQYVLFGGLALVLTFLFFIFKRLKLSQAQKRIIEQQNKIVIQKNKEILDSITYAKRIQKAILPQPSVINRHLPDSFVYYQPKDIVAGDFYWMEKTPDAVLFAAADCTGHGVPGAMVSVVCNGALNRSVREYGHKKPGEILNKTREIVITEFAKSDENVKDGMDIALCSLNGRKLLYAGAHNPLWVIRKGTSEVEEIKGQKQPIGKFAEPRPFITHEIELNSGDTFYLFSDGYSDQFGGEKGKKFKTATFKKLLVSIQSEDLSAQKELLHEHHIAWKGDLDQLDDICIIGVRIP